MTASREDSENARSQIAGAAMGAAKEYVAVQDARARLAATIADMAAVRVCVCVCATTK